MIKPLTNLPNYGTKTDEITIYAGPCSVESEEQFFEVAECIADLGLSWIRGGAFKPRTNPHSFQGLGEEGLKIMKAGGDKYGLKTLTEVMDSAHTELVHSYVDGLQVGARNMQNFSLLKKIGEVTKDSHKMVLLKRGLAGTISEWLSATEYITMNGNDNVVLCERGLRTFETTTRFTLDISAVPDLHRCFASRRRARPRAIALLCCSGGRCRLDHDRGASESVRGPLRRSSAAHAGSIPRTGRAAA